MDTHQQFAELVRRCRSYRRFDEGVPIPREALIQAADTARMVASGANRQPLRYRLVSEGRERALVFGTLKWAAALRDWEGPTAGERPTGYIVICDAGGGATTSVDEGIAAQTIMLAMAQAGFGGCMLHAFDKKALAAALGLPEGVVPLMVLALGKPAETVQLEELSASPDGSTAYWRDASGVHHVPKRSLKEVLL